MLYIGDVQGHIDLWHRDGMGFIRGELGKRVMYEALVGRCIGMYGVQAIYDALGGGKI